jgi:hypothetical protein
MGLKNFLKVLRCMFTEYEPVGDMPTSRRMPIMDSNPNQLDTTCVHRTGRRHPCIETYENICLQISIVFVSADACVL